MYTPISTMECEQYQDLSQLSWYGNAVPDWAVGEVPPNTTTVNDLYGLSQATSLNLMKFIDMDNQFFKLSREDSMEEVKGLPVTAPMEVVPMRHHEAVHVCGIIKTEADDFDVGREEEITNDTTFYPTGTITEGMKIEPHQTQMDDPDDLLDLGGRDLIDYLNSEEPPQPIIEANAVQSPSILPAATTMKLPMAAPQTSVDSCKSPSKRRNKYLAISREFTTGVNEENKIPKMLDLSTINLKDLPGMSIGERIKTVEKRRRAVRHYDATSDDDNPDEDYVMESKPPVKRVRRISSTSISSASTYKYHELRVKNNEASRKSRLNRKERESSLRKELEDAEKRNMQLRSKFDFMEKFIISLRKKALQNMLNKR